MKKTKATKVDINATAVMIPLDYIHFTGVPMKKSKQGPVMDLDTEVLEQLAAKAVIQQRVPLRGAEVKFLRNALGLSLEKFARKLGVSSGAVFHWEKNLDQRLLPVNEVAVRTLLAEELNIDLLAKFSLLLGDKKQNINICAT